jgi:hypothetical protein
VNQSYSVYCTAKCRKIRIHDDSDLLYGTAVSTHLEPVEARSHLAPSSIKKNPENSLFRVFLI